MAAVGLAISLAGEVCAEPAAGALSFEVASIRPAAPPAAGGARATGAGPGLRDPGRITYPNTTLKSLLMRAYGMKSYQIVGPNWLDSERFDIAAKIPSGASREQLPLMLRTLLADRFKLTLHREKKELPVYALLAGKNGPKLKESRADESSVDFTMSSGRTRMSAKKHSISGLTNFLSGQLDRPVLDATELEGDYDYTLEWAPQRQEVSREFDGGPAGPSIFTALQEQLGLKLEPRKGPVELLVVDHAERVPTEN